MLRIRKPLTLPQPRRGGQRRAAWRRGQSPGRAPLGYDSGMAKTKSSGVAWHRDPRAGQLVPVGLLLMASGLAHGVVWVLLGGPWEGPVTWRKPILFGLSGGLTSLSAGWVWSKLPPRRGDAWLAAATAWALFVEVLLIDLQRWRGVASHFNRATPLDSLLSDAMGLLILFVSAVLVDLTVRLFRSAPLLAPDMLLAARAGMMLLAISCGLGIWVSVYGDLRVAAGLDPGRYGAAGVPKFPHGAVIHAIQWLPAIAWAARRAGWRVRSRVWLVAVATVATAAVLAYALGQTLTGRGRFELGTALEQQMPTIGFDLDRLDADGLAGPPDGKVAISYEFRIPDTPENRAAVRAIDPTIEIGAGPRGRVDAGPGFALCIGSTHQPRHREILVALAGLSFIERIAECFFD